MPLPQKPTKRQKRDIDGEAAIADLLQAFAQCIHLEMIAARLPVAVRLRALIDKLSQEAGRLRK